MKKFILAFILAAGPAAAETCLFTHEDTVVLNGPCYFESQSDGSFTIWDARGWKPASQGGYDYREVRYGFTASLFVESEGIGRGFANLDYAEDDPSVFLPAARSHASLGMMRRHGACWLSESSALCAWK